MTDQPVNLDRRRGMAAQRLNRDRAPDAQRRRRQCQIGIGAHFATTIDSLKGD